MSEEKKFLLRIKPDLWNELQAWADDEMRSVNGQIEYLLRDAVRRRRKAALPQNSDEPQGQETP